jgi:dimeric dUTPase (all-alpha-NTP-PPase superfamily)
MDSEIKEIRQLLPWKWWKNEKEIDMEELRKEVIDLWHFLPSLSMKVGFIVCTWRRTRRTMTTRTERAARKGML